VERFGVVGGGTMGNGIAHVAAQTGFAVTLCEVDDALCAKAVKTIDKNLQRGVDKGKMTAEDKAAILGRITPTTKLEDLAGCDIVVEAVVENFDVKKKIFQALDGICGAEAVLASNTSSISITKLAATTKRPGKVIGMLFIGKDREIALAAVRNTEWSIMAILAIVGSLMVFAGILVARSITRPINRAITSLSEAAEQVVSASSQVSSASQSLAEGASEQAASIEETSSSLEEMSSMTKQNADNASTADNLMKESKQMVERANGSMTELTQSMVDISKASDETSKIIKTIDEIAFQTNLLALNAAVEAARAGEAGAGFAVVANEVRNLAMRAAEAAKNTSVLIEGTVKKVKEGSELVERTGGAFSEVSKSAAKVAGLVAEIAAASSEQAQGIDQINKAVTEMDKVTQQTAANAEESASASEEMNAQAEQMKEVAGEIMRIVGSGGSKGAGKEPGEPVQKAGSVRMAPFIERLKAPRAKSPGASGSRKPSRPEEVIPFGEGNFKDF